MEKKKCNNPRFNVNIIFEIADSLSYFYFNAVYNTISNTPTKYMLESVLVRSLQFAYFETLVYNFRYEFSRKT